MKGFKRLTVILLCICMCLSVLSGFPASAAKKQLIIGGMNFGVKFFTDGLLVVGITDVPTSQGLVCPAKDKINVKDFITHLNGEKLTASQQLVNGIKACDGKDITLTVVSEDGERQQTVTPVINKETGNWCIGVFVRDSTAGIGTVTYIDAETGTFGGLGHGICDTDTGALLTVGKAYVVDVNVTEIVKGVGRTPGELKGVFDKEIKGEIYKNLPVGVFGMFNQLPADPMYVSPAKRSEVKEGEATVYCQIDGKVGQYKIEIAKIYKDSGNTKNFLIKVTDKELLSKTGGIVQGMSGSPIVQNGHLVGAVTHV